MFESHQTVLVHYSQHYENVDCKLLFIILKTEMWNDTGPVR
jgi:hypothetical protein